MPYINQKPIVLIPREKTISSNRADRQKAYKSKQWKDLRNLYIAQHPLCEICLQKGIYMPATDVHHLSSPFEPGLTEQQRQYRLLLWDNLQSLCKECHGNLHYEQQKRKRDYQKEKRRR